MSPSPLQAAIDAAPERASTGDQRVEEEIFIFGVGALTLGAASHSIREVTRLGPITPLPRSPAFVMGVVGHRGDVVPLVDLLRFFAQGEMKPGGRSRFYIGENQGQRVGFLTDAVFGLRRIDTADRIQAPMGSGAQSEFVTGLVRVKDLPTVSLLDLPRIIAAARARVVAR